MSDSAPFPVDIPPGIVKTTTHLAARGRWVDGDKVRFVNARAEKWGGWEKHSSEQLDGLARGALGWTASSKVDLIAMGTWRKLYSIDDMVNDITPLRDEGTLGADPFETENGSPVVTVTHAGHGLANEAIAIFSGADPVGGITIEGAYPVTIIDADHYTIAHSESATSDDTGGGAAVAYEYEINPGSQDATYGIGVGAGPVGAETVGTPRTQSVGIALDMRFWSLSRYGNMLIANPTNGSIYLWNEPAGDDRAEAIANAPASVRFTFVTAERYIFALGCDGDDMLVRWPARDDLTDWNPDLFDDGNTRRFQDGNKLMAGCVFNDAVNLFWSDTALYQAQYQPDADFVYDTPVLKTQAGLVSQAGYAVTPIGVFWVSGTDILLYDGSVQSAPNFGDLRDWFYRSLRADKTHKLIARYNPKKNEVQFHYCSTEADENDSYIAISLDTYSWTIGTMTGDFGHTAMATFDSPGKAIFAAHADGYIYEHERGVDADGQPLRSYIEHSIVALSNGDYEMDIFGYQPDFERQDGDISLRVSTYDRPRDEQRNLPVETQTFTIADSDKLVDMMLAGRYAKSRITSNVVGGDYRLGVGQFEIAQAGETR
jgi:hypothetical protein